MATSKVNRNQDMGADDQKYSLSSDDEKVKMQATSTSDANAGAEANSLSSRKLSDSPKSMMNRINKHHNKISLDPNHKQIFFEDTTSKETRELMKRKVQVSKLTKALRESRSASVGAPKRSPSSSLLKEESIEKYRKIVSPKLKRSESRRAKWIETLVESKTPEYMMKVAKNGNLHGRYFQVSSDGTELNWWRSKPGGMFGSFNNKKQSLILASVKRMIIGPSTEKFMDYDLELGAPWLCFSLVSDDNQTVDIQCFNQDQFNRWFLGLQELIPLSNLHVSRGKMLWYQAIFKTIQIAAKRRHSQGNVYKVWRDLVQQARIDVKREQLQKKSIRRSISPKSNSLAEEADENRFEATIYLGKPIGIPIKEKRHSARAAGSSLKLIPSISS